MVVTSWLQSCSCSAASRVAALIRKSLEVLSCMYCIRFTYRSNQCKLSETCHSKTLRFCLNFIYYDTFCPVSKVITHLWLLWECDEVFLILLDVEDQIGNGFCLTQKFCLPKEKKYLREICFEFFCCTVFLCKVLIKGKICERPVRLIITTCF